MIYIDLRFICKDITSLTNHLRTDVPRLPTSSDCLNSVVFFGVFSNCYIDKLMKRKSITRNEVRKNVIYRNIIFLKMTGKAHSGSVLRLIQVRQLMTNNYKNLFVSCIFLCTIFHMTC